MLVASLVFLESVINAGYQLLTNAVLQLLQTICAQLLEVSFNVGFRVHI